jgi:propionate CoA-transferase
VAAVAREEKLLDYLTLTTEPGVIGGVPSSGLDFGAAVNTDAIIAQNQQFDFYDGGGLDLACLGMAECDSAGNVNVSRFGKRLAGAGGFINISQSARKLVFAGTFTSEGLEVAVIGGRLSILHEGKKRKFVRRVEQVTFSGSYATQLGQQVYYVTERCVFQLKADGLELIEVAPGIDIQDDIMAQMDFAPIVRNVRPMDERIFRPEPIDLKGELLHLHLHDRISYDPQRNILFHNFAGMFVRHVRDVEAIRQAVEKRCRSIGRKVAVVVNYDSFQIEESVTDAYAEMVGYLLERYYTRVSRYTTSAFLRMKLGDALSRRGVAPHIFESEQEARSFHQG